MSLFTSLGLSAVTPSSAQPLIPSPIPRLRLPLPCYPASGIHQARPLTGEAALRLTGEPRLAEPCLSLLIRTAASSESIASLHVSLWGARLALWRPPSRGARPALPPLTSHRGDLPRRLSTGRPPCTGGKLREEVGTRRRGGRRERESGW